MGVSSVFFTYLGFACCLRPSQCHIYGYLPSPPTLYIHHIMLSAVVVGALNHILMSPFLAAAAGCSFGTFLLLYGNDDANRYSYAGCLRTGEGGVPQDLPKAVSLFEQLGDKGLLEAKVRHM